MCTVASARAAFRVRAWQITSWRRGHEGGRPLPEGLKLAIFGASSLSRGPRAASIAGLGYVIDGGIVPTV